MAAATFLDVLLVLWHQTGGEMADTKQPRVFISYSRGTSQSEAQALKELLGDDAYLDLSAFEAGADFVDSIAKNLLGAQAFVDSQYFSRIV